MKKLLLFLLVSFSISHLMAQSMEWLCRPGKFSDIQYMGFDLFKVRNNVDKWGIVSAEGKEVLDVEYDSITPFVENRALIMDEAGRRILGILDTNGDIIKSFENEEIYATSYPYYKDGLLGYKERNGLCGYINSMGRISISARFYLAAPFQDGVATVQYADGDGYYGLINKSGGSAIISDTKYKYLSSVVDGQLLAVTSSSRGGDLLRIMRLDVNRLKATKTLESKMFVDLSDDFTYLVSQNGHHYFIDNQWRITGANYNLRLPYQIVDQQTFITESAELLSKQYSEDGVQITYMGKPILEHSFDKVETYEKKYAIVCAKDKTIGILKLNPSAGIEVIEPTRVFVFNHNPLPPVLTANLDEIEPEQYIEVPVDIKDVNTEQLKCYINEDGYLRYAPLKQQNGVWKLHLPYFQSDTKFDNIVSNTIDIAVTYDGLDWMHRSVKLLTKHEPGYDIEVSGNNATNESGQGFIEIIVQSIKGVPNRQIRVDVTGHETVYFKGDKKVISIPVSGIPEGKSRTFTYTVTVAEEGCPIIKKAVSKTISHPKQSKKVEKNGKKKEVIII